MTKFVQQPRNYTVQSPTFSDFQPVNGGVRCDMKAPCACGAWHRPGEKFEAYGSSSK